MPTIKFEVATPCHNVRAYEETWDRTDRYCPSCGVRGLYRLAGDGFHACVACGDRASVIHTASYGPSMPARLAALRELDAQDLGAPTRGHDANLGEKRATWDQALVDYAVRNRESQDSRGGITNARRGGQRSELIGRCLAT